jgi:c-di-GMP-related signal transduction protein
MNEATSIFMTMIESTLNKMIDARIEAKVEELNARLKVVEALEEQLTSAITLLDTAFNAKQPATTATLDLQSEQFRDAVRGIADEAVETHCEEYDHDLIHEEGDTEDAIDTALRQALRTARIELR